MSLARFAIFGLALVCLYEAGDTTAPVVFPPGSPHHCLASKGDTLRTFEVLAGGGWDNLRNLDMSMIMALNYSRCRTTEDGRYLIPDNLYTIPIKRSKVDKYAEMFEHWDDYTSTTSAKINAQDGFSIGPVSISGKFSAEYKSVKSNQYFHKSVTTRVQVRYIRYVAKLAPGSGLSDEFRRRLRKIGDHIRLNRTQSARYDSQILVRDFGTHVITNLDVGAILSQVDNVQSSDAKRSDENKMDILVSASASFYNIFNFNIDISVSSSDQKKEEYQNARTSSDIMTWGGPIISPHNFSAADWSKLIENDMVAIDRSGDPIFFLITDDTLPDIPTSTVIRVRDYVKEAVELYYKHNTYPGCTRPDYPKFNFQANADDGTCLETNTNFTFGGVFQTCDYVTDNPYTPFGCTEQSNPLTDTLGCPDGYEAIKLYFYIIELAQFHWFWCNAIESIPQNSGFLFGGLYSDMVSNMMTGESSCPAQFYPLRILGGRLNVCVSDDYDLEPPKYLPFAGFFSCQEGNPLAMKENAGKASKLQQSMRSATRYPTICPKGSSQHLALSLDDCEIYYCMANGGIPVQKHTEVNLPPFMKIPDDKPQSSSDIVFNDHGTLWTDMDHADTIQ